MQRQRSFEHSNTTKTVSKAKRFVALAALLGLPTVSFGAAIPAQQSVSGKVTYQGEAIRPGAVRLDADPKCEALHEASRVPSRDRLVAEDGGVANVFLYVKDAAAAEGEPPSEPVVLGQEGCFYTPRVMGIRVGQPMHVSNSDPTLHNVRFLARSNRPFNLGQPPDTAPREKIFRRPEMAVKFKCDVHPWMKATLFIMEHSLFTVTDDTGSFTLSGLPAGTHTLVAWHEEFGEREITVEVAAEPVSGTSVIFE